MVRYVQDSIKIVFKILPSHNGMQILGRPTHRLHLCVHFKLLNTVVITWIIR